MTVGTHHAITGPNAIPFFAFLTLGTHDGDAQRIDTEPIAIAHFARTTNEFTTIAFRNAGTLVADFARFAKVAFVRGSIAIVVETVALFGPRLIRLHTRKRSILALHRSIVANAWFARCTRSSPTRTRYTCDKRREIVEIVVSAGKQIFPAEVKRIGYRRAVVDEQVDEGIGLIAVRIVLLLAVEDVIVVSRGRAPRHTFVKPNFAARIIGIVFDIERFHGSDAVRAQQKFVQISHGRRLTRHVVPAERILVAGISLQHGERQPTRRNEPLRCGRGLGQGIDVFPATGEKTLQAIPGRNRCSIRLGEGEGLA